MFRTTAGHVLSAQPHRLPTKLHREDPFLALTRPTQYTATVDRPLPTLVVHRSFLSITAPLGDQPTEWLHRSQVFHTQTANPEHLLDPELETYRLYRHRESQETPRHLTRPEALAG